MLDHVLETRPGQGLAVPVGRNWLDQRIELAGDGLVLWFAADGCERVHGDHPTALVRITRSG